MARETMNSRERINRTLRREAVDRCPIDLGSHPSTGISAFAYLKLKQVLGLGGETEIWDLPQMLARVEIPVLERFHCDLICLSPAPARFRSWQPREGCRFLIPENATPVRDQAGDWVLSQPGNGSMRMPEGSHFFDGAWLSHWEKCSPEEELAANAREAERLFKETDYALNYTGYATGPQLGGFFGGLEESIRLLEEPDEVKTAAAAWSDRAIAEFDRINRAMGPYLSVVSMGCDLGIQSMPYIRAEWFEEFYSAPLKRVCEHIHRSSEIKIFLHSCGSIKPLIPLLIEAGIDCLNPVQISADDMDPAELKREFGDRIIFWGGVCDTQHVLGVKTPAEVSAHVAELMKTFKPGGGLVANQVHNIMGNVPPENIIAMFDTIYRESFNQ